MEQVNSVLDITALKFSGSASSNYLKGVKNVKTLLCQPMLLKSLLRKKLKVKPFGNLASIGIVISVSMPFNETLM